MDISKLIKAVILDVKSKNHEAVLRDMTSRLVPLAHLSEEAKSFCDLREHESAGGLLAGSGSAIFHCLSEDVKDTLVAMAISKKGVPTTTAKASASESIRIFFLIISPIKESGTHLEALSHLEGLLLDKVFHHAALIAKTAEEAITAVRRALHTSKPMHMPLGKDEVLKELGTTEAGLSEQEASKRLALTGPNTIKKAAKSTLLKDFFHNLFFNLFAVLLWAGGALSFASGMPELGWAIFLVIIINASFSFWQEYKAEMAVEALKKLLPRKVRVIRGDSEKEVDANTLVPGDLIILGEGKSIPADGRLIEADNMRVDNSALTGESRPVYKISEPLIDGKGFIWTEIPNLVFAGTSVVSGAGRMVVTATGMDTEIGKVAYLTQTIKPELSPLQKEMARITKTVTFIAVALGAFFFLLGRSVAGLTFAESFIFAIGIIVANVPEGLLPTVSLSLAMGVQRMAGKNAIVKKLSAVETLGSATVICTDKTGTLTTNQMCATGIFVNNIEVEVTGSGYAPDGGFFISGKRLGTDALETNGLIELLTAASLCNNASLHAPENTTESWSVTGDPTEGALLTAAQKAGLLPEVLRQTHQRIAHFPFERVRKRMSLICETNGKAVSYVKGAPKETIALCSNIFANGRSKTLTEEEITGILKENDLMAGRGLRVLAVASKPLERKETYAMEDAESGLTLIGLIAMIDPPRPEVKDAVTACKKAGIKIVVATGDYGLTAKAIANKIGLDSNAPLITGEELNGLSDTALKEILKKDSVIFARVAPKDKLRVVTMLQENNEVVAVTGDGVNDAPALKKADIGIAMGMRGSDVAKEAAEIILADDNFATIVDAIKEGRAVYSNIKKFVTYIFASNIPEIVPFIAFVIFKIPLPLTVMQILAVDLGTDVFPALGLGVEPPEKGIMEAPPRPKNQRLLDFKTLARAYLFLGPIEAALCLAGFFLAYRFHGWSWGEAMAGSGPVYAVATTMTFAGIVAAQVGNVFACRTEKQSVFNKGLLSNRFVLFGIGIELLLLVVLIYTPKLAGVFGFAALTVKDWLVLLTFPAVMLLSSEIRKALLRRKTAR
ncbi:HAD family hydrolase [bacterium]|nr:MAG: HAD family hydrolase [bacterium]